jgi:ceramide glucosyltransferase
MTASLALSLLFFATALFGLLALTLQTSVTALWMRKAPSKPTRKPGISILKPLCGVDDDLAKNLEYFAQLDYPNFELILGVKNARDPAYPVAQAAVRRWPERVRLVLQRGEPGMNPKVNQLITLSAAARHDLLVVSDSNVRVPSGYLDELAAAFEDPQVACVTNPIVGIGERRLGSLLDNLHLGTSIGPGMIAAKRVGGQDIVVGKSMAVRRSDLLAMGGFESTRNYLAEDYVIGGKIKSVLGKRVAVGRLPVYNVSLNRSVKDFFNRYLRWSVIHRTAITPLTYVGQGTLNPVPLATLGLLAHPSATAGLAVAVAACWKITLDLTAVRQLREESFGPWAPAAVLLKDFLIAIAWTNGLFDRTVVWRGNRLRVLPGSRLVPLEEELALPLPEGLEPTAVPAWSEPHDPGNRYAA